MSKPIRRSPPWARWRRPCRRRRRRGPTGSRPCRGTTGFGEAAVRLHEVQPGAGRKAGRDPVDIAAQDRRQIGVDHRRVAAADELDQRRDLVADRDLGKSDVAGDFGQPRLVIREGPAVHQHDGQRADASGAEALRARPGRRASSSATGPRRRRQPARRSRPPSRRASTAARCAGRKCRAAPGSRCAARRRSRG